MTPTRHSLAGSPPETLIERFAEDPPRAGRAMRKTLSSDPRRFVDGVIRDTTHDGRDRGYRYALVLWRDTGRLTGALADSQTTSLEQAPRTLRATLGVDRNFVNTVLDDAVRLSELREGLRGPRILELVEACRDSVFNWRAVTRLHGLGNGRLRARCHFNEQETLVRLEKGDPRERADLVEALWGVRGRARARLSRRYADAPRIRVPGQRRVGDGNGVRSAIRVAVARRAAIRSPAQLEVPSGAANASEMRLEPASTLSSADAVEGWFRVTDAQGEFVSGVKPVDFFLTGADGPIFDYSVEPATGNGTASVRVVCPVRHAAALERALPSRPEGQAWALSFYGEATPGSAVKFMRDETALGEALAARECTALSMEGACEALLKLDRPAPKQHLAVLLDGASNPYLDVLFDLCRSRGIQLHYWPGTRDAETLPRFLAALRERCEVRAPRGKTVREAMVRDTRRTPPAFSPGVAFAAGELN